MTWINYLILVKIKVLYFILNLFIYNVYYLLIVHIYDLKSSVITRWT